MRNHGDNFLVFFCPERSKRRRIRSGNLYPGEEVPKRLRQPLWYARFTAIKKMPVALPGGFFAEGQHQLGAIHSA